MLNQSTGSGHPSLAPDVGGDSRVFPGSHNVNARLCHVCALVC